MSFEVAEYVRDQVKIANPHWRLYIQSAGEPGKHRVRAWEHGELVCNIGSIDDWIRNH